MDMNILQTQNQSDICHNKPKWCTCNKYNHDALHHMTSLLTNVRTLGHLLIWCIVISKGLRMGPTCIAKVGGGGGAHRIVVSK